MLLCVLSNIHTSFRDMTLQLFSFLLRVSSHLLLSMNVSLHIFYDLYTNSSIYCMNNHRYKIFSKIVFLIHCIALYVITYCRFLLKCDDGGLEVVDLHVLLGQAPHQILVQQHIFCLLRTRL